MRIPYWGMRNEERDIRKRNKCQRTWALLLLIYCDFAKWLEFANSIVYNKASLQEYDPVHDYLQCGYIQTYISEWRKGFYNLKQFTLKSSSSDAAKNHFHCNCWLHPILSINIFTLTLISLINEGYQITVGYGKISRAKTK